MNALETFKYFTLKPSERKLWTSYLLYIRGSSRKSDALQRSVLQGLVEEIKDVAIDSSKWSWRGRINCENLATFPTLSAFPWEMKNGFQWLFFTTDWQVSLLVTNMLVSHSSLPLTPVLIFFLFWTITVPDRSPSNQRFLQPFVSYLMPVSSLQTSNSCLSLPFLGSYYFSSPGF